MPFHFHRDPPKQNLISGDVGLNVALWADSTPQFRWHYDHYINSNAHRDSGLHLISLNCKEKGGDKMYFLPLRSEHFLC